MHPWFKNYFKFAGTLLTIILFTAFITKINLKEQSIPPGTNGQLLFNNAGVTDAEDPVVSQPTASLLNATVVGTGTFAVQASQSGTWNTRTQDGSGNAITSTTGALDVNIKSSGLSNQSVNLNQLAGNAYSPDPCAYSAWNYFIVNTATNVQIVAGSAAKNVFICQAAIVPTPAAANTNIEEGTGSTCGTGTTGMLGGATAALGANLNTNGGFVLPSSGRAWTKTATSGDSVCLYASAQVSGVIAYVGPI